MSTKSWQIRLDRPHVIIIEHGYFSARRRITVDGREIADIRPGPLRAVMLWNTITEHPFELDGHACAIRVDPSNGMNYQFDLLVDGRSQKTGTETAPLPLAGNASARQSKWLLAGFLWSIPFAFASVLIGQLGTRRQGDALLYIAGFVGMGVCFAIGRAYGDRPLQGVLRCVAVVTALILLALVRVR
jgi:FAIM1 (Fas apoptotic inhibitory molecule) protein